MVFTPPPMFPLNWKIPQLSSHFPSRDIGQTQVLFTDLSSGKSSYVRLNELHPENWKDGFEFGIKTVDANRPGEWLPFNNWGASFVSTVPQFADLSGKLNIYESEHKRVTFRFGDNNKWTKLAFLDPKGELILETRAFQHPRDVLKRAEKFHMESHEESIGKYLLTKFQREQEGRRDLRVQDLPYGLQFF